MIARWVAPLLAFSAFCLCGTTAAQASCTRQPPIQDEISAAPVVFVGTVVYTSNFDRQARVKVESIWHGPSLPAYVDVNGSAWWWPGVFYLNYVYKAGVRYLFILDGGPPFQEGGCSPTQSYSPELAAYAPADARAPNPATPDENVENFVGQYWPGLAIGSVFLIAIGTIAILVSLSRAEGIKRRMSN